MTITQPGDPTIVDPNDNYDVAIFKIKNPHDVTSYLGSLYDTPSTPIPLKAGQTVEKIGRTTGYTKGYVHSETSGPLPIRYSAEIYGFGGVVYFMPTYNIIGFDDVFSDSGDSGSLITTMDENDERVAVGIVVGGGIANWAPGGKITIALPILPALQKLNVSLVSNHNI